MRDNPGGGELDPTEGVHRRCMKNSPSVLSCIGKRTKEGPRVTHVVGLRYWILQRDGLYC